MNTNTAPPPPTPATPPHPARMTPAELRTSTALSSIFALRMLGLFLILPVFSLHARHLPGGENLTLVGLAIGIYGLTQGCLQIPFGIASDRLGRRRVIVVGLLLFAAGSFIAALAADIYGVILGRALQGAGAISAAVTALIADGTRDEVRTKAMAMVGSSIGATFALSLVLAPWLYSQIGMNGLFNLTGLLALGGIWVMFKFVPANMPVAAPAQREAWHRVLLHPELLRLNAGIFVLHLVQMAMFVAVPIARVEHLGLPVQRHGWVYLPVVLASFALMLPPLLWGERHGRIRTVFLGSVALLLVTQTLLAWLWTDPAGLVLLLLAFFVGFNVLEATLPSLVSRVAPAGSKGLALGVYNTTQAIGLFFGGLLGGKVAERFGHGAVFQACAGLTLLWLLLAWPMKAPSRAMATAGAQSASA